MPLFEYHCEDCGETMEILQSVGSRPKRKCPDCGGKLTKAVSAPAFQFKGTGWYVTDYADKKKGAEGSSNESADGSSKETSGASDKSSDGGAKESKSTKSSDKKSSDKKSSESKGKKSSD